MPIKKKAVPFKKAQEVIQEQTLKVAGDPAGQAELAKVLEANLLVAEALMSKDMDALLLPEAMVVIEMEEEEAHTADLGVIKGINEKLDALTTAVAALAKADKPDTDTGDGDGDGDAPPAGDGDGEPEPDADADMISKATGIAFGLAMELLNGYIAKLNAFKAKIEATDANVTSDEVWEAFEGSWDVKEAISAAKIAVAKADDNVVTKAKEIFLAEYEKYGEVDKDATDAGDDADQGDTGDGDGVGDAGSDDADTDDGDADPDVDDGIMDDLSPPLADSADVD